jgi:hypothetical protein
MPEEILPILIVLAILALVGWAACRIYCGIVDEPEPETHGDEGGRPAPETSSGLLAGDRPK